MGRDCQRRLADQTRSAPRAPISMRGRPTAEWRVSPCGVELVDHPHPFGCHVAHLLEGALETDKLLAHIVHQWFEPVTHYTPAFRKEEIGRCRADQGSYHRACHDSRLFVHTPSPVWAFLTGTIPKWMPRAARARHPRHRVGGRH